MPLLLSAILIFVLALVLLGYTISTVARTQMQAMQLTFFFFLPSLLLSGFMFPYRGMPGWAQVLGEIFPLTHFLRVIRAIMLKGADFPAVSFEIGALVVFIFAYAALALLRFRGRWIERGSIRGRRGARRRRAATLPAESHDEATVLPETRRSSPPSQQSGEADGAARLDDQLQRHHRLAHGGGGLGVADHGDAGEPAPVDGKGDDARLGRQDGVADRPVPGSLATRAPSGASERRGVVEIRRLDAPDLGGRRAASVTAIATPQAPREEPTTASTTSVDG